MSSSRDTAAVDSSFLACPCLNVKLHLPSPVDNADSLTDTTIQLGLGGVSMEQKILGALTLSSQGAMVSCSNCNHDVYSFKPDNAAVEVNKTSVAFLTNGLSFSPADGRVIPQQGLLAGKEAIQEALAHPNYSSAFRLILTAPSPSSAVTATDSETTKSAASPSAATTTAEESSAASAPLSSYLQRIRTLLDQELEASLVVQEQRTLARIAAFKSQQLLALEASQKQTIQEKERLWDTIQQRVVPPATPLPTPFPEDSLQQTLSPLAGGGHPSSTLSPSDTQGATTTTAGGVHPFDLGFPGTLPIRFSTDISINGGAGGGANNGGSSGNMTGANTGSILQRWRKPVQTDVATSLQLKEFDDRMHSIGMRRQSKVSGPLPQYEQTGPPTAEDLAASEALVSTQEQQPPTASSTGDARISHGIGAARHITIVEPAEHTTQDDKSSTTEDLDHPSHNGVEATDDESDDDDDDGDGVVFDLDEELGFDNDSEPGNADSVVPDILNGRRRSSVGEKDRGKRPEEEEDDDDDDDDDAAGVGQGSKLARQGGQASSMMVGSLRLNYLRRQKKLEAERLRFRTEEKQLDEELQRQGPEDEDRHGGRPPPPTLMFGTSLPIQIHRQRSRRSSVAATKAVGGGITTTTNTITTTTAAAASTYAARNPSLSHGGPHAGTALFNPPEQLTLPPASSPAGEMLRRRLSRTYGSVKEMSPLLASLEAGKASAAASAGLTGPSSSSMAHQQANLVAGSIPKDLYTGTGTIAIDPFMLLDDDDEDEDEEGGEAKRRTGGGEDTQGGVQQDRSNGGHGRAGLGTNSHGAIAVPSLARSAQPGFEPPHIYSARTYVGETPWEMPTRVTVKARGADREGADLDMQLTLQMARELEEAKRTEKAELREARRRKLRHPHHPHQTSSSSAADVIQEEENEQGEPEEEEEEEEKEEQDKQVDEQDETSSTPR